MNDKMKDRRERSRTVWDSPSEQIERLGMTTETRDLVSCESELRDRIAEALESAGLICRLGSRDILVELDGRSFEVKVRPTLDSLKQLLALGR